MPDDRFFRRAGPFSLSAIAALVGAEPPGSADGAILIDDIAPLDAANADDISVFFDPRYIDVLQPTRAGAIIISPELARHAVDHGARLVLVGNPVLPMPRSDTSSIRQRRWRLTSIRMRACIRPP